MTAAEQPRPMGAVWLNAGRTERVAQWTALRRAEEAERAEVECAARLVLRATREEWVAWLVENAREELARALNRLDVTRARLAALRGPP